MSAISDRGVYEDGSDLAKSFPKSSEIRSYSWDESPPINVMITVSGLRPHFSKRPFTDGLRLWVKNSIGISNFPSFCNVASAESPPRFFA